MRVQYYGNVMDVLVQHHPEYVSLAWGTMKFFFVVGFATYNTIIWAWELQFQKQTLFGPEHEVVETDSLNRHA